MRNMVKFIMVAVFALFCVTPFATKAEAAAKMAILPLINTVESEDAEKASAIYMEVVFDVFEFPQYDFVDEDAAIKAFRANGQSLSKAALENVAKETGSDIVVVTTLNRYNEKAIFPRQEPTLQITIAGDFAFYNATTGTYYNKRYFDKNDIEEILTVRNDVKGKTFRRMIEKNFEKVLKDNQ